MAEPGDNPCSSEDDECNHVVIVIESQYRESDFYDYVYNIYAKWNLCSKSLFKLLINLLH